MPPWPGRVRLSGPQTSRRLAMHRSSWLPSAVLAVGLAGWVAWPVTAAPKKPVKKPGPNPYLTQLHNLFKTWDTNSDKFLDKEELAKAFRGPNAKPYDDAGP